MKTIRPIVAPWLLSVTLLGSLLIAQGRAANRTWTGAGTSDDWNVPANWGGTNPVLTGGDGLVFSGTNRLNGVNNFKSGIFNKIIFNADAASFVLSGSSITISGDVTNDSPNSQIIDLPMALGGNRIFTVNGGELLVSGAIGQTSSGRTLSKYGLGTLTLAAGNTYTGATVLVAGKLKLDMSAGGGLATDIALGVSTSYGTFNNGVFEVKGNASGATAATFGTLGVFNNGSAKIVVDSNGGSGTALTFGSLSRNGFGTLNANLSSAGSSVTFTTAPKLGDGILSNGAITVTDAEGTGFATMDGNQLVRLNLTDVLTASSSDVHGNYKIEGDLAIGSTKAMSTLTITGAGELSGSNALQPDAILMQEGTGDYTISTGRVGSTVRQLFIQQYSMAGTLRITGQVFASDAAFNMIKVGPGKLLLSGSSSYTGNTYLQGGETELDGWLSKTVGVMVYDSATLSGTGSIGNPSNLSAVRVRPGGTIRGGEGAALSITGSLTLEAGSHFALTLGGTGSGTVYVSEAATLGDADLVLSLGGAPLLGQQYTLLSGPISGTFATLNGGAFGPDQTFSLDYGGSSYGFQLTYGANDVTLQVASIPEPAASSLMALAGAGLALGLRRRKHALRLNRIQ